MGRFRVLKVGDRVGLDIEDESFLLWLWFENPFRSNLHISESLVSRWFNHRFSLRLSYMKADLVPIDKFQSGNILTYADFCAYILTLDPMRFVFTDEKFLKRRKVI